MSILIDKNTRVIVQGLGKTGEFHTDKAIAYGTQMVGAVHPTKAGTTHTFTGETDHHGRRLLSLRCQERDESEEAHRQGQRC